MRASLLLLLVAASVATPGAQRPVPAQPPDPIPASRSDLRPRELPVVVDGCLENRRLTLPMVPHSLTGAADVLRATEYILEGPRELLAQLARDHAGHHEQITGTAILPPHPAGETVDTRSRTIGGARVTGAVRQAGGSMAGDGATMVDARRPVRIRVKAATHVAEDCARRG